MNIDAEIIFDALIPFKEKVLKTFEFQKEHNPVYGKFCKALGVTQVQKVNEIPLLPIQAFKDVVELRTTNLQPPTSSLQPPASILYFQSSGTSGMTRSRHYLVKPALYKQSIIEGINQFYNLNEFVILAYTPGYNSNPNSSLVWMLDTLIRQDQTRLSRFIELGKALDEKLIHEIESKGKKILLFGAAFGLLDLIELGNTQLPKDSIIMETGGMKTYRREMTKSELHAKLTEGFHLSINNIHSEYGMTELLSQAYSLGDEWFSCVPWMKISIRNPENPLKEMPLGEEGLIGVIDLANLYSCSFIITGDRGVQRKDGTFKVLGRWNPINLRGCNFLIDQD